MGRWAHRLFSLRAEIVGELDRKVPMSRIYAKHWLRLGISYRQFIRLVREFREQAGRAPPAQASPAASESQRARAPVLPKTEPPRDFHCDPMDAYRFKFN